MPERRINDQTLIETAATIEKRRRRETIRTVIIVQLVTIAILLLLGALLLYEIRDLIDGVERQNNVQLIAIHQGRQADEEDAAAQQKILGRLEERIVPKADITALKRDVRNFRAAARQLRLQVQHLTAVINAQAAAGGG